jgi:Rrf2 family iron-sulfur cluster assembly transcriptional regulator
MRLTTKGRYAVTAMLDIALHRQRGPVSVVDIADRQDISAAYLEQLFGKLKRAGLLQSVRGPGGGYRLARSLDEISVSRIIAAVGEGVDATRCHGSSDCLDGTTCLTHDLWTELSNEIDLFLDAITLESLVSRREVRDIAARQDDQLIDIRPV